MNCLHMWGPAYRFRCALGPATWGSGHARMHARLHVLVPARVCACAHVPSQQLVRVDDVKRRGKQGVRVACRGSHLRDDYIMDLGFGRL